MKKQILIIIASLLFAMFIMSGGYGLWSETLRIEGNIEVLPNRGEVEAARELLENMILEMEKKKLEEAS